VAAEAAAAAPAGSDRVTRGSKRRRVNEAADDTQGTAGGNSGEERSDYEPTCSAAALSRMPTEVVAFPSAKGRAAAPPEAITTLGCLLAHKLPTLRVLIAHGNDVFADGAEHLARAVRAASQASTGSTPSAAGGDSFADAIGSASVPTLWLLEVAAPSDVARPASSSSSTAAAAASSSGGLSRDVQTSTTALASSAAVVSGLLLTTLDLSDTKLNLEWESGRIGRRPEPVCKLLKALGKAPQLTSLALAGNELCQLAAQSLGAWLAKSSCPLLSLDLSRNPFGDQGGEALAKGLRTNGRLQTLQLDECMLTDSSARKFQKTLKLNSRLCRLSLSWNGIEANGVIDLIQAVLAAHVDKPPTAKPALHHLDVSSNSFAVYADGTTAEQASLLVSLKDRALLQASLSVRLGHIYGHGLA